MLKTAFTRAALAAALVFAAAPAASALTIGMVDTMRVLNDYQGVSSAEKQFKSQVDALKKAYEDRLRKLQDARKKNMPKAQLEALERKYTSEIEPMKARVDQLNKELTGRLKKELDAAVHSVAAKKKMDVVFDKQAILHGGTDITADVLQELNNR